MTVGSDDATNGSVDKPFFGEDRRQQILDLVNAQGRIRVRDVAAMVGVTETTVRKDIIDLDRARLLRRTHGGALAINPSYERDFGERVDNNADGKAAIARACLEEILDGDAVYFDSGSTVAAIARLMADPSVRVDGVRVPVNVNVLTNAMDVAAVLAGVGTIRHTVLGGQYRPAGGCFVGPLAMEALERFTINTAFIGVSGISNSTLTVADISEAQLKNTAMGQSRRIVVPIDHTKFGASDFVKVCELDRIDMVITDRENDHLRRACDDSDVELKVAAG